MSIFLITSVILLQAAPPPVVFRSHAPAPAYASGFVAHCTNFRASLTRRSTPDGSALDIEVGGQSVPNRDIDRILDSTPILKSDVSPTILCGEDSLLISFRDNGDEYAVLLVGSRLESIVINSHRQPEPSGPEGRP